MQQVNSTTCKNTAANTSKQLRDSRDDKLYWVTKLKDNNCWMTQNLDYDDPNSAKYTSPWSSTDASLRAYFDPGGYTENGDMHALVGNYYTWQSAVNGTGTDSGNASGSICPTNWKLPTSNNTNSGSFGGLTSGISAGSTLIANPYYFQYGGYVASGTLREAGSEGRYWSSTASSSAHAYFLYFVSSNVTPSNGSTRYLGYSVRCLVQGS